MKVARFAYKEVFAKTYPAELLGDDLPSAFAVRPDGTLQVDFTDEGETVSLGASQPITSTLVLSGVEKQSYAETPDRRYSIELEAFEHESVTEFWLIHTDLASGKFKRAKLSSELRAHSGSEPRITVSPKGSYFIVDDGGTVRLYSGPYFMEAGTFQIANASTENRVVALTVNEDETLIAGLSRWKDIVLYNVVERRVIFVRQVRDDLGWYDAEQGYILVIGNTEAIVTVGVNQQNAANRRFAVHAFKAIPLNFG